MCDIYTAGAVFDALCPKRTDVPDNPTGEPRHPPPPMSLVTPLHDDECGPSTLLVAQVECACLVSSLFLSLSLYLCRVIYVEIR